MILQAAILTVRPDQADVFAAAIASAPKEL